MAEPAADIASTASPASDEAALPPRIVLFDGVCALCNWSVRLLVRIDKYKQFAFAPLQGETATRLRREHPEIPDELSSFVYVNEGRVHLRSAAFVHAARKLPLPWKLGALLWIVPWPLRDLLYLFVARIRYRVFGKYDTCMVPSDEIRERFLP